MDDRTSTHTINRRRFLAAGMATTAGLAAASVSAGATRAARGSQPRSSDRPQPRAKNVIFLVADGMSMGTLTLGDRMHRRRTGEPLRWTQLWTDPHARRAVQMTHSRNSMVTDSAAAGSAWGSGRKHDNGAINFDTPAAKAGKSGFAVEPEPMLVTARKQGKLTGLVTTTRVTHATPASFIANVPDRDMEDVIAEQIMERGVDVVLGGGAKHFPDELLAQHTDAAVVCTAAELDANTSTNGRLLGLFKREHMSFTCDRPDTEPTLAHMTRVALDRLSKGPNGFVMQIEGGRVDHAAHANDAVALVNDMIAFDEALGVALDFAADRDDTLIVTTTDHGNANPAMTVYKQASLTGFAALDAGKHSFEWVMEQMGGDVRSNLDRMAELLGEAAGVELSPDEIAWIARRLRDGERVDGFDARSVPVCVLGAVLANHFGVAFLSPNHTSDDVEMTAIGPGSELIPAVVDNTEMHGILLTALGLEIPRS